VKSQEIAPACGNFDDNMLGESDVYGSGSSIGVDCDGGQLTLSNMMAEKTMVATCRGTEVLGGAMQQDESSKGDGQLVVV
jgi:hypothetical protein